MGAVGFEQQLATEFLVHVRSSNACATRHSVAASSNIRSLTPAKSTVAVMAQDQQPTGAMQYTNKDPQQGCSSAVASTDVK